MLSTPCLVSLLAFAAPQGEAPSPAPLPLAQHFARPQGSWAGPGRSGSSCGAHEIPGSRPYCRPGHVVRIPGWLPGDTHAHVQRCTTGVPLTSGDVVNRMLQRGIGVANVLAWESPFTTPAQYLAQYVPLVTGAQSAATAESAGLHLQYGVEVSGFHAANLGHVIALGITEQEADIFLGLGCPYDDGTGDYAAPLLDHFRARAGAVTGYAHVTWPVETRVPRGSGSTVPAWNWEDPRLPAYVGVDARCSSGYDLVFPAPTDLHFQPLLAALDVALGKVDFLETIDLTYDFGGIIGAGTLEERWYGLYYKLLSAGLRVGIAGGTDVDCYTAACDPVTWVHDPLFGDGAIDYDRWLSGLAAGRTTLSAGTHQLLELAVDDALPGDELALQRPATVEAVATYHVSSDEPVDGAVEFIVDGEVRATRTFHLEGSGAVTVAASLPLQRSTWIAARTADLGTHTAALYAILDEKPIADCASAEYWTLYSDYLLWLLQTLDDAGIAEQFVGCSLGEIRRHVIAGKRIFAALRDYAAPLSTGVDRVGPSTGTGAGPIGMGSTGALSGGAPPRVHCFNAPRAADGWLLVGRDRSPYRTAGGALIGVQGAGGPQDVLALPVRSSDAGFAEAALPATAVEIGDAVYAQFYWPAGGSRPIDGASEVLRLRAVAP